MAAAGIAVIGIGVRYPHAESADEFRANLRIGRDSVRHPPAGRIEATGLDPDGRYPAMGYLERIDRFDHVYFGLSLREAELLDPQHRLAQQLTKATFDDAGYAASWFRSRRTAVIFSVPSPGYQRLVTERTTVAMTGTWPGGLPARIAHRFGLTGPCYGIDTGCNGSLVAVHHARRELFSGDAQYALIGGVNIHAVPPTGDELDGFPEIMSTDGRCRAFDEAADGTVGGEGGAVLLLTTVDRAMADGAHIHAVITGSSVLHNGDHSATLSTPSARAQAEVIERAWSGADLDFASADYVEAHGSGTRLGDAVEVEGLSIARAGSGELPIGSVKTNVGHLDNAAGVTGLVKTILGVRHGELYPSLHFGRPAPGVDIQAAGLRVVTTVQPWPVRPDAPRRAGVSSFSLGGLNAHCVVEQAPASSEPVSCPPNGPVLVGVSARTPSTLRRLCVRLAGQLRSGAAPFTDVAFTLNEGRDHHEHRIAVLAESTSGLAAALEEHAMRDVAADRQAAPRVIVSMAGDAVITAGTPPPPLPAELPLPGTTAAWQLAMYAELARAVPVDGILASGRSRNLARWIQDDLSGLDTLAEDEPADPIRLAEALDQVTAAGPVVVLEIGTRGDIGAALPRQDSLQLASPEDIPWLIGRLYELGVDITWSALRAGTGQPTRMSLPGHPLEEVRCWVSDKPPPQAGPTAEEPVEAQIRSIFRDLLAGAEVAPGADFFELGGNSVIALQVIKEITARFGIEPKMIDIYEHRTVPELAAYIERHRGPSPASGESRLPPVTPGDELALSFGQERMWFHHQLEPGTTLYNLSSRMRVTGPFDPDAWLAALADFALRHETIRSNFVDDHGEPRLVVRPDPGDFHRFADLSEEDDPAVAERMIAEHVARPFDLATDPLYRVLVIRFGPENHLLVNCMHHAVNDGHAPTILRNELPELYAARLEGRPYTLPPLPVQYRDYARWQRELLAGSVLDDQIAYWQRTLRDAPVLNLPTDLPRPSRMNYRGAHHEFRIPADVMRRVRTLGQEESATTFVVLLAALNALLSRMSGQHDISVGTPTAGRSRPEVWGLLGFFNNTMVFRTDLTGSPGLRELVRRVRQVVLDGMSNEDLPFDAVVQAAAPRRDPGRNTLFDVLYTHQVLPPLDELENGSPTIRLEYGGELGFPGLQAGTAICDLAFTMVERPGEEGVEALIEYSTQLFYRSTIAGIANAFVDLLRELLGLAPDLTLTRVFEQQAARTPQRTALVCDQQVLTFAEVNARANRLAHFLAGQGIGPEDRVALTLPRTPDMIIAILATLKASAAYLPIDPAAPPHRVSLLASEAKLVITTDAGPAGIALDSPETVAELARYPDTDPVGLSLSPWHPAYVMYTSGSTGTPKGVVVHHQALVNLFRYRQRSLYPTGENLRAASVASFSFDGSLDGLLWMTAGNETHLITEPVRLDVDALVSYIADECIDYLDITPSYCQELIAAGLLTGRRPRLLVLAGEAVPEPLWRQLREVPDMESYNFYGPTECTVDSLVQRIRDAGSPLLGKPIDGVRAYVLGADLQPSIEGELYVAGEAVARGYLNEPGLTAQRFVADAAGPPGSRMYRTGDLVRHTPDGDMVFLGRADDQVQLRGFRIEPGEIEATLERHESVERAAVVVRADRLIAYVTGDADPAGLRQHVAESLPGHMVPAVIVPTDRLPLTANGKLDRASLPAPEPVASASGDGSPVDVLRELFAELLGLTTVAADSDFFELGGHSLLAARLAARIRRRFGGGITPATVFEAATPSMLATRLGDSATGAALNVLLPLRTQGEGLPLFCVHPGGGAGWVYSGLVSRLGSQRPVYALQARGLDGTQPMARTVTEMAADYRGQIRLVQPQGPYHLLGWSFGGVVAHEIATQLRRDGDEVALLAMMDSYLVDKDYAEPPMDDEALRALLGEHAEALDDRQIATVGRIMANNGDLARTCQPGKFDGDVVFFRATEGKDTAGKDTAGKDTAFPEVTCWDPFVGGRIELHDIACGHHEMTDPRALGQIQPILTAALETS
jgi:amino acid adenylation domain-containing protein